MVTPTDYRQMWNNVEHGRVRFYGETGCRLTVLNQKMNRSGRLLDMLRDTVLCRVTDRYEGGVRFVQVDPFFNYYAGLRAQTEAQAKRSTQRQRFSFRRTMIRLFSPLSVLRDVFFAPCFVLAALWKLPGSFDACLGIGPWGSLVGWLLKKCGKVRIVVYEDRDYEPGLMPDRLRQAYTAWLERFLLTRADLIISVGHRLAKRRRHQTQRPIHVIPNGVVWRRFEKARQATTLGHQLVYVGNLVSWSGLDVAISAMPRIRETIPDAKLLIVGSGLPAYEAGLKALVDDQGLQDAVQFLGSRPHEQLPEILAAAHVGLSNSQPVAYRQYACPLKVFEYMAAGLPVIATEATEAADIVDRYRFGLSVAFDSKAFADAAIRLFSDEKLYRQMRQRAIDHSPAMDWHRLLSQERSLIEERLGAAAGNAPTPSQAHESFDPNQIHLDRQITHPGNPSVRSGS